MTATHRFDRGRRPATSTPSDDHAILATAVLVTGGRTGSAWPSWLAVLWAAGAFVVSLRFLRGHLGARRLARAAEPAHAETWLAARREAARALAIAGEVGVFRSAAIGSPMTVGVRRPRVLLPMVDRSGTEARLRRILDPATPRRPLGTRFRLAARGATLALAVTLACTSAAGALPTPSGPRPAVAEVPSRGSLTLGSPSLNGVEYSGVIEPGGVMGFVPATDPAQPEGSIDMPLVRAEVTRHLDDLERCYDRSLVDHPQLAGTVVIHWNIAPDGHVTEQCVTDDTVGDPDVLACVNQLVASSRFPPPTSGSVNVQFPFVFATRR